MLNSLVELTSVLTEDSSVVGDEEEDASDVVSVGVAVVASEDCGSSDPVVLEIIDSVELLEMPLIHIILCSRKYAYLIIDDTEVPFSSSSVVMDGSLPDPSSSETSVACEEELGVVSPSPELVNGVSSTVVPSLIIVS